MWDFNMDISGLVVLGLLATAVGVQGEYNKYDFYNYYLCF